MPIFNTETILKELNASKATTLDLSTYYAEEKDVAKGHCVATTWDKEYQDMVCALALLPTGEVVSGSTQKNIKVWDTKTGECRATLPIKKHLRLYPILALAVLPTGEVASVSSDYTLAIWDAKTGECRDSWRIPVKQPLAVLPTGEVVSGAPDKTIKVWDTKTGECRATWEGHKDNVNALAVLPTGEVVSGSSDKTIKVWDAKTGKCRVTCQEHEERVNALAVLPTGEVVSGSSDKTIKVWDAKTGKCRATWQGHTSALSALAVLPTGEVVSGSYDIKVWDAKTGECRATWLDTGGAVLALAVLPTGEVVQGSELGIKVWQVTRALILGDVKTFLGKLASYPLHTLNLQNADLGDSDAAELVGYLQAMKSLTDVDVRKTSLTAKGAWQIQAALPKVRIQHESLAASQKPAEEKHAPKSDIPIPTASTVVNVSALAEQRQKEEQETIGTIEQLFREEQNLPPLRMSQGPEVQDERREILGNARSMLQHNLQQRRELAKKLNAVPDHAIKPLGIDRKEAKQRLNVFRKMLLVKLGDVFIRALAITKGLAQRKEDKIDKGIKAASSAAHWVPLPFVGAIANGISKITRSYRNYSKKHEEDIIASTVNKDLITAAELVKDTANRLTHDYQDLIALLSRSDLERVAATACARIIHALSEEHFHFEQGSPGDQLAAMVRSESNENIQLDMGASSDHFFKNCGLQVYDTKSTKFYRNHLSNNKLGFRYVDAAEVRESILMDTHSSKEKKKYFELPEARLQLLTTSLKKSREQVSSLKQKVGLLKDIMKTVEKTAKDLKKEKEARDNSSTGSTSSFSAMHSSSSFWSNPGSSNDQKADDDQQDQDKENDALNDLVGDLGLDAGDEETVSIASTLSFR